MRYFLLHIFLITTSLLAVNPAAGNTYADGLTRLRMSEGLASNNVNCVFQDSRGLMWFGTENGLSRYDGTSFRNYKSDYKDPAFFTNNAVISLAEDDRHRLWIGSRAGLNILELDTGHKFIPARGSLDGLEITSIVKDRDGRMYIGTGKGVYTCQGDVFSPLDGGGHWFSDTYIKSLFVDSTGYLWIAAWNEGVAVYDISGGRIMDYRFFDPGPETIYNGFFEDSEHNIWVTTWDRQGVFRITDPHDPHFRVDRFVPARKNTATRNPVVFSVDENVYNGDIWLATANGIQIIDREGAITVHNKGNTPGMVVDEVTAVFRDRGGVMWYAMNGGGVNGLSLRENHFAHYYLTSLLHDQDLVSSVTTIYEDREENLWIGLKGLGFGIFDKRKGTLVLFKDLPWLREMNPVVNSVLTFSPQRKHRGTLLIGTRYNGLYHLRLPGDPGAGIVKVRLLPPGEDEYNLSIYGIAEDFRDNLWVASSAGLYKLETDAGGTVISSRRIDPEADAAQLPVTSVVVDASGKVWAGTSRGIYGITDNGHSHYSIADKTLNFNEVVCLYQDTRQRVWAGTNGGGLSLYSPAADRFEVVDNVSLFPDDAIYAIREDHAGNLWLSTGNGLVCYNHELPSDVRFRTFTARDGLSISSFNPNSSYRSAGGEILFGGSNGFISFYPPEIVITETSRPPVITSVLFNNRSLETLLPAEGNRVADKLPPYLDRVRLPYDVKDLTVEFAVPDYGRQHAFNYSYMLEGHDSDWRYTGDRSVNYNGLPRGRYTFKVRSSHNNGTWSEATVFDLRVSPAPWNTWWARAVMALLLVSALGVAYRFIANKLNYEKRIAFETMERERSEKLYNEKMRFFTNISHEFFTPVTIALSALSGLAKRNPGEREVTSVIKANLDRLTRLLGQVIEFRKIEIGNVKLKIAAIDLGAYVRQLCDTHFALLAGSGGIPMRCTVPERDATVYLDVDKLDKVLYNLISNAVKYNKPGGSIEVEVSVGERPTGRCAVIAVRDTGIGMTPEVASRIFDRFYEHNANPGVQSIGVGLSLVRELVERHYGTVEVDSRPGEGTVFTVSIPCDREFYYEVDSGNIEFTEPEPHIPAPDAGPADGTHTPQPDNKPRVLLVEDNEELSAIVRRELESDFTVHTALNGKEALDILRAEPVDIIVTDIVMPEMDGIELTRILKLNVAYSHIPVVMLTARQSPEHQVEGFDTGADSYITKPFDMDVLAANIRSLLRNRETMARKFREASDTLSFGGIALNNTDRDFLDRVTAYIEKRVTCGGESLSAVDLYREFNLSQSSFYRKLQAMMGLSPNELIRKIRMQIACRMLREGGMNVSEVCYRLGFSEPKYFTSVFRKEIGMTPSNYIKSIKPKRE